MCSRTVQRLCKRIVRKRLQQRRVGLVPLGFNIQVHFFFGDGTRALVQRNLFDIGRHQVTLVGTVLVVALFNTKGRRVGRRFVAGQCRLTPFGNDLFHFVGTGIVGVVVRGWGGVAGLGRAGVVFVGQFVALGRWCVSVVHLVPTFPTTFGHPSGTGVFGVGGELAVGVRCGLGVGAVPFAGVQSGHVPLAGMVNVGFFDGRSGNVVRVIHRGPWDVWGKIHFGRFRVNGLADGRLGVVLERDGTVLFATLSLTRRLGGQLTQTVVVDVRFFDGGPGNIVRVVHGQGTAGDIGHIACSVVVDVRLFESRSGNVVRVIGRHSSSGHIGEIASAVVVDVCFFEGCPGNVIRVVGGQFARPVLDVPCTGVVDVGLFDGGACNVVRVIDGGGQAGRARKRTGAVVVDVRLFERGSGNVVRVVDRWFFDRRPHIPVGSRVADHVFFPRGSHHVFERFDHFFHQPNRTGEILVQLGCVTFVREHFNTGFAIIPRERFNVSPPFPTRSVAYAVRVQRGFYPKRFGRAHVAFGAVPFTDVFAIACRAGVFSGGLCAMGEFVYGLTPQSTSLDGAGGRVIPVRGVDVKPVGLVLAHGGLFSRFLVRSNPPNNRFRIGDFGIGGNTEFVDGFGQSVIPHITLLESPGRFRGEAFVQTGSDPFFIRRFFALSVQRWVVTGVAKGFGEVGCAIGVSVVFGRCKHCGHTLFLALYGRCPCEQFHPRRVPVRVDVLFDTATKKGHHIVVGELAGGQGLATERRNALGRVLGT